MAEQRKYRKFTAQQKIEIVLAGLRGERSKDLCREHEIAETLYYSWREKLLEGGQAALAGRDERQGEKELKKKIRELERALGAQDLRARDRGGSIAGLGVSERVARSRTLVARGYALAAVARVMQVTRQALYRVPEPRTALSADCRQATSSRRSWRWRRRTRRTVTGWCGRSCGAGSGARSTASGCCA